MLLALHHLAQAGQAQLRFQQRLARLLHAPRLLLHHAGLQPDGVLQLADELVVVVHHLGLHRAALAHAPAALRLLGVAAELLQLRLPGLRHALHILQPLARGIALARGGFHGDVQGVER